MDEWPEKLQAQALVFDGSSLDNTADLKQAYSFLHDLLPRLKRNGRVVVINRPSEAVATAQAAATQAALIGLVRSLSKEIGRKGSTANVLCVAPGCEGHLAGPLRFLLSRRSAFVTGQPIAVTNSYRPQRHLPWQLPLDNAVALVTGAARGIGAATARRLAAEGAHVFCLDRPEESSLVAALARDIDGTAILADVRDPETPARVVHDVQSTRDHLDVIVHNAGVTRDKTLARMSEQAWTETLEINLSAIMALDEVLVPDLLANHGRIICLSSIAGIAGNAGQTNYGASKSGLVGYVGHQGRHLESRGITVNAVAPGFIETRMTAAVPLTIRQAGRRLSSLGQGGLPLDVAEVITFLASPGAQGITGTTIRVCGGALMGA
jgi:3-oxoacyl-[acyl-carrier protein] reductase